VGLSTGQGTAEPGYATVNANPHHGEYARFQPGAGMAMSFDDLKTIEAKKFLVAVTGGPRENSTIGDAVAAAAFVTAAERSAETGRWEPVAAH
jgi:hypothetical protein